MEPNKPKFSLKDLFINISATVALYSTVGFLLNLLFTVINKAYPQINSYYSSSSISWPVAAIIVLFPVFIILMRVLQKDYEAEPERKNYGIHRWLTYLTLFISGGIVVGDLISVLYYFIDGQELTTGFLLKILTLLVIAGGIFVYYISDLRNKLNSTTRNIWRIVAVVIVVGSIILGFSVLGSPRTQRLYKYDSEKVSNLQNMKGQIESYYLTNAKLPANLDELKTVAYYGAIVDTQTKKPYEYVKTGDLTYQLCAEFNKASAEQLDNSYAYPYYDAVWTHPAGRHCFDQKINPQVYPKI